jgi:cell division initiation protein
MIDITPLDVRKKKGDFRRGMRGYDPDSVDGFIEIVADRMEDLVRENAMLRERAARLTESVDSYRERERAMNEALVSAQQLREDMRGQAEREREQVLKEAADEAGRILDAARQKALAAAESSRRIHAQRSKFVRGFRSFIERQLAELEHEEQQLREVLRPVARDRAGTPVDPDSPEWLSFIEREAPESGE